MISAISFLNNNINFKGVSRKQNPKNSSSKESTTSTPKDVLIQRNVDENGIYSVTVTKMTASQKNSQKRVELLTTPQEDGTVTLTNSKGEQTVLSRPLTNDEVITTRRMGIFSNNDKIKNYVDFIDLGLDPHDAISLAASTKAITDKFRSLITRNADGTATIQNTNGESTTLSGALKPQEAAIIVLARHKKVPDSRLQVFIDLIDKYGLNPKEASLVAHTKNATEKFIGLTTENEDGTATIVSKDKTIQLDRPLTSEEALTALQVEDSKLPTYQRLLDSDITVGDAFWLARDDRRSAKFFTLTTPDENNQVNILLQNGTTLTLPRALSQDEALLAIKESFSNQKIYNQLQDGGKIHSTRRNYNNL